MPASHVQLQPDSTGKDIDAQSLTSTETGTPTVYRQNIVIADPTTYGNLASVDANGNQQVRPSDYVGATGTITALSGITLPAGSGPYTLSPAANSSVTATFAGAATASIYLNNAQLNTLGFMGSIDGTNWFPLSVLQLGPALQTFVQTTASSFAGVVDCAGLTKIMVLSGTNWTAQTTTVTIRLHGAATVPPSTGGLSIVGSTSYNASVPVQANTLVPIAVTVPSSAAVNLWALDSTVPTNRYLKRIRVTFDTANASANFDVYTANAVAGNTTKLANIGGSTVGPHDIVFDDFNLGQYGINFSNTTANTLIARGYISAYVGH